jgi:hypothetical protein
MAASTPLALAMPPRKSTKVAGRCRVFARWSVSTVEEPSQARPREAGK